MTIEPVTKAEAVAVFLLSFTMMILIGGLVVVAGGGGMAGSLVGYGVLIAIPILWFWHSGGATRLGLRPTSVGFVMAAVLLGCSFWVVNVLVNTVIPFHPDGAQLSQSFSEPPFAVVFVVAALCAPFAEEVLFRGILMPSFVSRLGATGSIVLSALLFACYHLSLPQLIPAFFSGLALGVLATRARSIVPGIVAHAFNNAIILVIAQSEGVELAIVSHMIAAIAVAVLALLAGVVLLLRTPRVLATA